jgi:hypothetical protein
MLAQACDGLTYAWSQAVVQFRLRIGPVKREILRYA